MLLRNCRRPPNAAPTNQNLALRGSTTQESFLQRLTSTNQAHQGRCSLSDYLVFRIRSESDLFRLSSSAENRHPATRCRGILL